MDNSKALFSLCAILGIVLGVSVIVQGPSKFTGHVILGNAFKSSFVSHDTLLSSMISNYKPADQKQSLRYQLQDQELDNVVKNLRTVIIYKTEESFPSDISQTIIATTDLDRKIMITPPADHTVSFHGLRTMRDGQVSNYVYGVLSN